MPPTCTICRHPERVAIEKALVAGTPLRTVTDQYGPSHQALLRHKPHMGKALVKAQERREVAHGDNVLDQLETLHTKVLKVLSKAESLGNLRLVLGAVREARSNLEFWSDLLTRLRGVSPDTVVMLAPEGINMYNTPEAAEQAIEKARGILGDARVDEILAEMAVRKARRLVDQSYNGWKASHLDAYAERTSDSAPITQEPHPSKTPVRSEAAQKDQEARRRAERTMGPRDWGPPLESLGSSASGPKSGEWHQGPGGWKRIE